MTYRPATTLWLDKTVALQDSSHGARSGKRHRWVAAREVGDELMAMTHRQSVPIEDASGGRRR